MVSGHAHNNSRTPANIQLKWEHVHTQPPSPTQRACAQRKTHANAQPGLPQDYPSQVTRSGYHTLAVEEAQQQYFGSIMMATFTEYWLDRAPLEELVRLPHLTTLPEMPTATED